MFHALCFVPVIVTLLRVFHACNCTGVHLCFMSIIVQLCNCFVCFMRVIVQVCNCFVCFMPVIVQVCNCDSCS